MTAIADSPGGREALYRYQRPRRLSSLSVVMPAHDEADNIEAAVVGALHAAARVTDTYEVVVVDDGSTDGTDVIVESLSAAHGDRVRLVRNEHNLGYGPTARRAWSEAGMDWLLFTDSDCQFDLDEIADLVPFTDEADIVTGHRKNRHDPLLRRVNAHVFNAAGKVFFGTGVRDVDCAFKLMRTEALRGLDLTARSAMVNTELLYQARAAGLRVRELPVTHLPRTAGEASGGDLRVIALAVREFFAMRWRFAGADGRRLRTHSWAVALFALLAGTATSTWTIATGRALAYGDAEAHLNISKRVVGGLTNGLGQLGSVWLPLPHLLMAPFVVSDTMWHLAIAGALVGVPSLVLLAVTSFRLAHLVTGSVHASWLCPLVIVANPNTLYLTGTPMSEIVLLAMVTASVYFLARWAYLDGTTNLVLAGLFGSLATLARYDGWALVCFEAAAVVVVAMVRHRSRASVEGLSVLFGVLAFSGIGGWLLWNQVIFGDPLYFSSSVYGSAEQQQFFLRSGLLPTYHDLGRSFAYWFEDVRLIVGSTLGLLAVAGLVVLVVRAVRGRRIAALLVAGVALSCFAFYILSLYVGQASLILPRFAPPGSPWTMSNIRYGVQALLPVGLFVAALAAIRPRLIAPLLALLIVGQAIWATGSGQVMAYADGTRGLSSQAVSKGPDSPAIEAWMRSHYDGGRVLMDDYRRPIGPVESGVPMSAFIGVGNKPYWTQSLQNPGTYARWVILQEASTDAVWTGMSPQAHGILADHFVPVFHAGSIVIFEQRPAPTPDLVARQGQHLYLDGRRWNSVGVNSYDLLAGSTDEIEQRLVGLAAGGHNTVRTWCFDKDGGISDATLDRLGQAVVDAREHGVRLVCALGNTLSDWGGPGHFTPAGEEFFTSPTARGRYEDQLRRVLDHRDPSGLRLADDPGILAWDLLNEPRVSPGAPPDSTTQWAANMADIVGQLDQKHLVTIGAEGFDSFYPVAGAPAAAGASSFAQFCDLPQITLCSAHLFPKYLSSSPGSVEIGHVVDSWRSEATRADKPVILEEAGFSLAESTGVDARHAFYDNVARAIGNSDADGGLLWNLGAKGDQSFTLAQGDPDSERVLSAWAALVPHTR